MASTSADSGSARHTPQGVTGDVTDSDEFRMYYWKILPCRKRYSHDWSDCVFAHNGEKVQRRCPRKHNYKGFMCPDMKKNGSCPRGDMCGFAHNSFEYWLHPTRYRTELCTFGTACKRSVCFFAHTPAEQRLPSTVMGPPALKGTPSSGSPQEASASTPPSTPPTSLGPTLASVSAAASPVASSPAAPVQHRRSTGQLSLATTAMMADAPGENPWPPTRASLTFQPASTLAPAVPQLSSKRRLRAPGAAPTIRPATDANPRPRLLTPATAPAMAPAPSPRLTTRTPSTPASLRPLPSPTSTPPQSPLLPSIAHQLGAVYTPQAPPQLGPPADPYSPMPQMLPPSQQQYMQYTAPDLQQYIGGTPHQQYIPDLAPPQLEYSHSRGASVTQLLTADDALHFGELAIDDLSQVDQSHYGSGRKWGLQEAAQAIGPSMGMPFSAITEVSYYPITTAPVPGYTWTDDY